MTLIAGIILPNGILMMSDTRTLENKFFVHNENTRKITVITPNVLLGSSGFETTYHTAQVLRQTLYDKKRLTNENVRFCIEGLYKQVNNYHLVERDFPEPLGHILIGEFDPVKNEYSLHVNSGVDRELFSSYTDYREVKNIELIGANPLIRKNVKQKIAGILEGIALEESSAPRKIAELCHNIFKYEAETYQGINQRLYCIYLTTLNGRTVADTFFRDELGNEYKLDINDDSRDIVYK
ncbi:hypothetical protein ACS2QC_17140 [Bacillus cereus group sp. Bce033]|uniref:hypothetical protein n=2 Tax=Bacillaceae TaxID=186817 RepID=UPI000F4FA77D|nr:hypothetical protein [Bacillus sp. FDAARGOS_527]AYY27371.1 hypothetical protein EGX95_12720 [Bacillus sp. FDAARGOS_527]